MELLGRALGLGVVAGLRSMAAPALFSMEASRHGANGLSGTPFEKLASPEVAKALGLMAVGELIVDKLPVTPNRTELPSVIVRTLSGALVGAAVFTAAKEDAAIGAIAGAVGALAGTFGGFSLRQAATDNTPLSGALTGAIEDAIALGGAFNLAKADA